VSTEHGQRVVVLVLDGFGLGEMPDRPAEDAGANTLRNVDRAAGPLELPHLGALGLGLLTDVAGVPGVDAPTGAVGKCRLDYPGADTFMGHQELMGGGIEFVELRLLGEIRDDVTAELERAGFRCEDLVAGSSPILVDGCVVVHDNVEARARLNINLTASMDDISFERLTEIGQVVRAAVRVPRVIVVGGRGFNLSDMRHHLVERDVGQIGIDTPALGVYDEHYEVRHLGVTVETSGQLPTMSLAAGYDVLLLGKAADVVQCDGARSDNLIATDEILSRTIAELNTMPRGLIVANVQETDLAGHEQDAERFARMLHVVDHRLPELTGQLREGDVLFITGDHGNDPTIGHSQHTREFTPAVACGPRVTPVRLGTRTSLADIGATAADWLDLPSTSSGHSFFKEITCS
jgi:phosphopentomutase